ncbi:hypothetical protein [Halopiger aswanensis]|uniref:Uncharacterized protein n=1 Tax=Halopiger aswanensis TaxID=148449 RepID=A0A3R7D9E9_9EURY|nr:hypothetical protein [Halopiger aswanensis]RKD94753.1 hypothetical protein ATJ93_1595 [Halopiger aswanensis]
MAKFQTDVTALRARIIDVLELDAFPINGHRHREYLERALDAGFSVQDLATAHEVRRKTIYRAAERNGLELERPPANGLARRLWEMDPDAIGGDA